ncbi:hypothetical protein D3C85_1789830 [compost metagenome]
MVLPARVANQGSQPVVRPPVVTRQRALAWSTSAMVPARSRFSMRRSKSAIFMPPMLTVARAWRTAWAL